MNTDRIFHNALPFVLFNILLLLIFAIDQVEAASCTGVSGSNTSAKPNYQIVASFTDSTIACSGGPESLDHFGENIAEMGEDMRIILGDYIDPTELASGKDATPGVSFTAAYLHIVPDQPQQVPAKAWCSNGGLTNDTPFLKLAITKDSLIFNPQYGEACDLKVVAYNSSTKKYYTLATTVTYNSTSKTISYSSATATESSTAPTIPKAPKILKVCTEENQSVVTCDNKSTNTNQTATSLPSTADEMTFKVILPYNFLANTQGPLEINPRIGAGLFNIYVKDNLKPNAEFELMPSVNYQTSGPFDYDLPNNEKAYLYTLIVTPKRFFSGEVAIRLSPAVINKYGMAADQSLPSRDNYQTVKFNTTDISAPFITSINRVGTSKTTTASTVSFDVSFSEAVSGVTGNAFYVDFIGGTDYQNAWVTGYSGHLLTQMPTIAVAAVSSTQYRVTISGLSNRWSEIGLKVKNYTAVTSTNGGKNLVPNPNLVGETYLVQNGSPAYTVTVPGYLDLTGKYIYPFAHYSTYSQTYSTTSTPMLRTFSTADSVLRSFLTFRVDFTQPVSRALTKDDFTTTGVGSSLYKVETFGVGPRDYQAQEQFISQEPLNQMLGIAEYGLYGNGYALVTIRNPLSSSSQATDRIGIAITGTTSLTNLAGTIASTSSAHLINSEYKKEASWPQLLSIDTTPSAGNTTASNPCTSNYNKIQFYLTFPKPIKPLTLDNLLVIGGCVAPATSLHRATGQCPSAKGVTATPYLPRNQSTPTCSGSSTYKATNAWVENIEASNNNKTYTVTVANGDLPYFNGPVFLKVSGPILDYIGNPVNNIPSGFDNYFLMKNAGPLLDTIALNSKTSSQIIFSVTFTENVQNVETSDFEVIGLHPNADGNRPDINVTAVSQGKTASTYNVTVSGSDLATYEGSITIAIRPSNNITNSAGLALQLKSPVEDDEEERSPRDTTGDYDSVYVDNNGTAQLVYMAPAANSNAEKLFTNGETSGTIYFKLGFTGPVTGAKPGDIKVSFPIPSTNSYVANVGTPTFSPATDTSLDSWTYPIVVTNANRASLSEIAEMEISLNSSVSWKDGNNNSVAPQVVGIKNADGSTAIHPLKDNDIYLFAGKPKLQSIYRYSPRQQTTSGNSLTFKAIFSQYIYASDLANFKVNLGSKSYTASGLHMTSGMNYKPVSGKIPGTTLFIRFNNSALSTSSGTASMSIPTSNTVTNILKVPLATSTPSPDQTYTLSH